MARGVVILECPRTPQSEVWARSYGVLNGALPRDSAQQCECCGEGQHTPCRAPLLEECPQHHGHKADPGVTPGTCGTIGERAQVILV